MSNLTDEDIAAIKLATGGVECEHGTTAGQRYARLCELGYVNEATPTANGIAWKLTRKEAEIAYAIDGT